ncbi:MAG: exo-alpha-sialidase [Ignavibacteria bacterium]|nr:exo-alpha-sialidase [Ignavibacteria bacterium]
MNGIRGTFPTKSNIRVNGFTRIDVDRSGGPRNGWIYVVAAEKSLAPAGSDPDVILHKSTDGGTTWSAGIRVNQDALNNGKYQWFPAIRVDESGGVNIVYYDDRNTASNASSVFMSRSIDGGVTWTDTEVSDHTFVPAPISGLATGYQGDYIGITSGNNKIWPLWADNSTGIYQAWTTSVDLGPGITHTPLPNTEQLAGNYAVNCVITPSGSGINPSLTKLLWSRNNVSVTDSLLMTNTSGNNWTANIPANGSPATYRYYIKTTDSLSRTATSPAGAPLNLNLFLAQTDNTKPVIVHTALTDQPKPNWPATVTATVTDNLGLDSSWVVWYKNSPLPTKQFKLINTSGSTFAAAFNSLNSDVAINDNIYYKIFAQDNSLAHNRDSTVLYSFKISDQVLCEDFTSATFAPTGWNIEFTGTNYWTRNTVSGYGTGSGSAKFDFWSASAGTTQSLVTLAFGNSVSGDSLKYDYAYAPYSSGTDSLEIQTSTNAGTTYTSLVRLYGNSTSGIGGNSLNTTATNTSAFTPTSVQWLTKKLALPAGTNKVKFRARSGFGNNLYLDNICKTTSFVAAVPSTITFAAQGYFDSLNTKLNIRDSAVFYLRNINAPYAIVDSGKSVVDSISASGTITFANAQTGTYYVVVTGRNILETWSKAGGEAYTRGTPFSYNFTTAANKAYGNNLILVGARYCIYSGDVIQNYVIDLNDILQINNAAGAFVTGFNVNDLTGNRIVDLSDVLIAFNNSSNFVIRKSPPGSGPLSAEYDSRSLYEQRIKVINENRVQEDELPGVRKDEGYKNQDNNLKR